MRDLRIGLIGHWDSQELSEVLRSRGASVTWAQTTSVVSPEVQVRLAAETAVILSTQPAWIVASTGIGLHTWLEAADARGQGEALRSLLASAQKVARGAGAAGSFRALGLGPVFVPPPEADATVAAWLARKLEPGDAVAVQLHCDDAPGAYHNLPHVRVLPATVPRCTLPADLRPAHHLVELIARSQLDLLVAGGAAAARNLLRIAADLGRETALTAALRERVALITVGPLTACAFEQAGVGVALMSDGSTIGDIIAAVEGWRYRCANPNAVVSKGPVALIPDCQAVRVGARAVPLGRGEFAVLAALVRRPQVVCRLDQLAREAWGHGHGTPADPTRIRHVILRIRRKLGPAGAALQSVRSVGYRYNPSAAQAATIDHD